MNREQRYYASEVSLRTINGRPHVVGIACPYGRVSRDIGGFREIVRKGAFRKVLQKSPDVYALFNHSRENILGRTKSGTLSLRDTDDGLGFDVELPNTQLGNDIAELCSRGDLSEVSYGFIADPEDSDWQDGADVYDEDEDRNVRCTLRCIKNYRALSDVSLVSAPANFGTKAVLVRSLGEMPADVRQHVPIIGSTEEQKRLERMKKRQSLLL